MSLSSSRPWLLLAFALVFGPSSPAAAGPQKAHAQPAQVIPPSVTKTGPVRKLSDIPARNDLLKLSGKWWALSLDSFPRSVGLQPGDYSVGNDPKADFDSTAKGNKVIFLRNGVSVAKWTPVELPVSFFTFKPSSGMHLAEISGFFGGRSEQEVEEALARRYGQPTKVLRALNFTTYVWDFDDSVLNVNFMSFTIAPNRARKTHHASRH